VCSDVINFSLEKVIIPRWFLLRSSSLPRVYVDYYFHVEAAGCVRVDDWSQL